MATKVQRLKGKQFAKIIFVFCVLVVKMIYHKMHENNYYGPKVIGSRFSVQGSKVRR